MPYLPLPVSAWIAKTQHWFILPGIAGECQRLPVEVRSASQDTWVDEGRSGHYDNDHADG